MNEILASLLAWVVANTAYEAPARPPELVFKSAEAFRAQVCLASVNCAARGYYKDGTGRIFVHESYRRLANVQQRALVVHELVHYLQDLSGLYKGEKSCGIWVEREREAFRVQLRYMARHTGDFNMHFRMPRLDREQCEAAERRRQTDASS